MTPHFSLREFTASETARRLGFTEQFSPPKLVIANLEDLALTLEEVRSITGAIIITSGYRCPRLNAQVGSTSNAHPKGYAADIVLPTRRNQNLVKALAKLTSIPSFAFDQIILEYGTPFNPSWVHLSIDPKNRRQWKSYGGGAYIPVNYRAYL